jgi:phosphatidylinositol alpha-1,6-mannosyltransferase
LIAERPSEAESAAPTTARELPRLLLVLTEFPPRIGGMQTHAVYLSRQLAARGYDVTVVTYRPDDPEEGEAALAFDARLPFPVLRVLSRLGFWHNLDVIQRLAARLAPDLVYSSTVYYGLLRSRIDKPVLCRSVGNDVLRPWIAYPFRIGSRIVGQARIERYLYRAFRRLEQPEWIATLFRAARNRLMQRSAREMDLILANSDYTALLLAAAGVDPNRVSVLVGGVDAARFARPRIDREALRRDLGLPAGSHILLTACRLEPKKGVDFLLEAFAQLRTEMPDAYLVVVGDGKEGRRCREIADRLGLAGSVRFAGRVPHEQVHQYYWAADLFVLASREYVHVRTGLRDAETMGRVLCEANAAGLPVLAARSGGIPSIIADGENGRLFAPDDLADFLEKLRDLRGDPSLCARLAARGEVLARERFDWQQILEAHERAFKVVLEGTRAPA